MIKYMENIIKKNILNYLFDELIYYCDWKIYNYSFINCKIAYINILDNFKLYYIVELIKYKLNINIDNIVIVNYNNFNIELNYDDDIIMLSLGENNVITFQNIKTKNIIKYIINSGDLLYISSKLYINYIYNISKNTYKKSNISIIMFIKKIY